MNEWAAKQSFFRNTGNRLIHPDPSLPLFVRILGYLFRVVVVVFFSVVIGRVGLKKYVMSTGFSERAAASFAEHIGAESLQSKSLFWKGKRVSIKKIEGVGSSEAIFRKLSIDFVQFATNPLKLLGAEWDLGDIAIGKLAIEFRSGAVTDVPVTQTGEEALRLMMAGFGSAPEFDKLKFGTIEVMEANLTWGLSDSTKGSYVGGLLFQREENEGDWKLELKSGIFNQNWLVDVGVENLVVRRVGDKLLFEEGLLTFGEKGTASVKGEMTLGAIPRTNIALTMANVDFSTVLPAHFHGYIDGRLSGPLVMSGSINTRQGIEFSGELMVSEGKIRRIAVFESIAMVSEVSRFRQMPMSGGSFRIKTGGDSLTISEINTQAEEFGMLKGGFTVSRSEDLTAQESLINEQLKAEGRELKKSPYLFGGEVFVGVQPEKLENAKKVADRYFTKSEGGFSWASIHLSGELDELTIPLNEKIIEEMRVLRAEKE